MSGAAEKDRGKFEGRLIVLYFGCQKTLHGFLILKFDGQKACKLEFTYAFRKHLHN